MQTFPIAAPHESQAPLEQQHSARQVQLIRSTYRLIGERGVAPGLAAGDRPGEPA